MNRAHYAYRNHDLTQQQGEDIRIAQSETLRASSNLARAEASNNAMHSRPYLARPHGAMLVVTAAISTAIAIGMIAAVTGMFQSRGEPLGQLAAAERACSANVYVSDREACMRDWIAAAGGTRVAVRK